MLSNAVACPLFLANANILPSIVLRRTTPADPQRPDLTIPSALQPEIPESGALCYSNSQRSAARQKN